jgi:KOW motif
MSSWREGDRVQVLTGPFKGFQGIVVQESGDHPIICLHIFGRVTRVALEAGKLGPDDGGGGAAVREPRRPHPPLDSTGDCPILCVTGRDGHGQVAAWMRSP